jgi:hypothetical protein
LSTYGFSVYDTGYYWQGVFYPTPSQNLYGLQLYSQLSVQPFTAVPRDYSTITLTWTQPQGTWYEFRLVANRYGYPVDQNDGMVLLDSTTYPGSQYADQNVIPGTYHYYGIYLRVTNTPPFVWERVGFASCLSPADNKLGGRMYAMLPNYFREYLDGDLTTDAAGNVYLQQFLNVLGWGFDYLKTQYDVLFEHLNDPMAIPLGDLVNLAVQLGVPFQPEVPASLMRKAVANWTHNCQLRGTPGGLSENITLLTGYPVDLQSGSNRMLEMDQAQPLNPVPPAWQASIGYALNELVSYGSYIYKCILVGNVGHAPSGSTSANTWWTVEQNVTDPASTLANPNTVGGINTWQALYPGLDSGGSYSTPSGSLVSTIGLPDPLAGTVWQHGAISIFNKAGTTQDVMLRSVSQVPGDRTGTNTSMAPDPLQAIKDGIPVPRLNTSTNGWVATKRYATGDVVLYDGQLFQALRASTGATPLNPYAPLNANFAFETSASPWTGLHNATIAQSATQAFQGSDSMRITPDGTTAQPGALSELVPVVPNASYVTSAWVFCPTASQTAQIGMNWYDSFGQYLSSTFNTPVGLTASTWTQMVSNAQAPAGAATGQIFVQLTGTPANTVLSYWDLVTLGCAQTPEWEVLSRDGRLRYTLSGYVAQSLTTVGNQTVQVVPFVEWYDEGGNLITSNGQARVFPRVATPGTPGGPPNLTYDSFALGVGQYLNGRTTDDRGQQWSTKLGGWLVSGFNNGSTYPVGGGRNMSLVTGLATGIYLGVTFGSSPSAGNDLGIVFRASDNNNYWRAGMTGLYKVTAAASSLVGSYSTACSPGDRLVVFLNGSSITVYRNGAQVLTTTDSYNSSATLHGIVEEAVGV